MIKRNGLGKGLGALIPEMDITTSCIEILVNIYVQMINSMGERFIYVCCSVARMVLIFMKDVPMTCFSSACSLEASFLLQFFQVISYAIFGQPQMQSHFRNR